MGADALHLLAAGVWLGGLPLLGVLLAWARRADDVTADIVAAEASRLFSALGLVSVSLLVLSGIATAWSLVGDFPALVGTPYGRLLLVKVGLFLLLLAVAARNLLHEKPRLLRLAAEQPRGNAGEVIRRLQRNVLAEATVGGGILLLVGWLGITPPAKHVDPTWPFSFRWSWQVMKDVPGVQTQIAVGIGVAMVGFTAALLAVVMRRGLWAWMAGAGVVTMAIWLAVSLQKLAVDAYPTTYLRPTVPYQALSIANGLRLYQENCEVCHGEAGYGDGPAAAGLRPRPADLTAKHAADHTAGDIFWWLTHGIKGTAMPGFRDRLSAEERWDLINFVRTLSASEQARPLGPRMEPTPRLAAPDFTYSAGAGASRALKEHRGRGLVQLVLFSVAESRDRLMQLNDLYPRLRLLGTEILGVPMQGDGEHTPEANRPAIAFPVVVDGAADIVATYTLFRRRLSEEGLMPDPPIPSHLEFLVDRQGYLRARWVPADGQGWDDSEQLIMAIEQLNQEPSSAPAPDEHVH